MRQLGDSSLVVPDICLGTMTWGEQNTEAEAHEQLSYALDRGVNFMDAAEMYPVPGKAETQGLTERYIGSWLKTQRREDLIIASKVCGRSDRLVWLRDDGRAPRVTRADIHEAVDKILDRLGTDYIDLLQIHWPDRYVSLFGGSAYDEANEKGDATPFEEQLEGLREVIDQGKVRYVGVSNETSYGVMRFCQLAEQAGLPRICSIQNSYSLIVRNGFETDLAETCSKRNCNVGLLAYSPLAGGSLTGKYNAGDVEGARLSLFPGYMARFRNSIALDAIREYCEVASKHGMSPTELALGFVRSRWFVTSTIIGATTMDQLKANIDAFESSGGIELSPECLEDVDVVFRKYRDPAMR